VLHIEAVRDGYLINDPGDAEWRQQMSNEDMDSAQVDRLLRAGWLPPIMGDVEIGPDSLTPLGKRVKDCFGWEIEAIGRFHNEVAAVIPDGDERVGDTLTDYQMLAMLWRIVAEAEKATRS
jgi:hypothetical protein